MVDTPPHLLVVDDDFDIRDSLAVYFEKQGFTVSSAADAVAARRVLQDNPPDLVLLDIMMPGEDGVSLGRHIVKLKSIPVIFLSARTEDIHRIEGLEIGADDYVCKPANPRELLARANAVLRRNRDEESVSPPVAETRYFSFDRWTLDSGRRQLVRDDDVVFPLSASEHRLIQAFIERPQLVLTRERLLELTRSDTGDVFDRSIDSQISRFRRKLERDPKAPELIKTVYGGGYVFTPEVKRL
ncbi:MAG: response regulator [Pseudomonadota bacterium]